MSFTVGDDGYEPESFTGPDGTDWYFYTEEEMYYEAPYVEEEFYFGIYGAPSFDYNFDTSDVYAFLETYDRDLAQFYYYDSAGSACQFDTDYADDGTILGFFISDPWEGYHCPYTQEGWTYSYVTVDEENYPVAFQGPDEQDWSFYEYEQIFGEDNPDIEAYCDSITDGIDLYEYRYSCWDFDGTFDERNTYCKDAYTTILERYYCYQDASIYKASFCEADRLTELEEPDF